MTKQEAKAYIIRHCNPDYPKGKTEWERAVNMAIKALSDRPKGEWIWQLANNGWVDHICSVCGYTENTDIHVSLGWKYCPNCGAEMKGTGNEDN